MPDPLSELNPERLKEIEWLLTDVDDTLTWQGKLPPEALIALAELERIGVKVVAVTGACAGWCDQMAKMWPLHGVIGENGAFWMRKDTTGFNTTFSRPAQTMINEQRTLQESIAGILVDYPDVEFSQDQTFRYCDVAVNIAQNRTPVAPSTTMEILNRIVNLNIESNPVNATLSSIHINAWVGNHSKRTSAEAYIRQFNEGDLPNLDRVTYVGDSLNDEGMFGWLPLTFAVNNIRPLLTTLNHQPSFLTQENGGFGFAQLASLIVKAKACHGLQKNA
ncbi:HAD-IIB family hydrolase [Photobacterium halotolerans]|uniref:HAD-IIB family hydrolase n=1 Tax=Photobacterium halotolerans TaxID=265726 RepID=A0A7X4WEP0_9GAMM|nr:HAD-IIB family hydrolase [Photobacterium halotolerans]NAW67319.1 HAD-IIB family hydrolase [Photobacterium halotolerans]